MQHTQAGTPAQDEPSFSGDLYRPTYSNDSPTIDESLQEKSNTKPQGDFKSTVKPTKTYSPSDVTIIDAVQNFNAGWNNRDYAVNWTKKMGSGKIYCVSMTGQNGYYYENFAYERGSDIRVYNKLDDLVKGAEFGIFSLEESTIRTFSLAIIGIILVLSVIGLAVSDKKDSLEALIAFAGIVVGYIAGKNT